MKMFKSVLLYVVTPIGIFLTIMLGVLLLISPTLNLYTNADIVQDKFTGTNSLEEIVAGMNKYFPKQKEYYSLDSVFIEKQKVIYKVTVKDKLLQYQGVGKQGYAQPLSEDFLKKTNREQILHYYLIARKNKENPFNEELLNRKFSQEWRIYKSHNAKDYTSYIMSWQEMKKIKDFCEQHPKQAKQQFLKDYVARQKELIKVIKDEDITSSVHIEKSAICYVYTFSKNFSNANKDIIENIRTNKADVWQGLLSDLHSLPLFHSSQEICTLMNMQLIFRYRDYFCKDSIDFTMPLNRSTEEAGRILYNAQQK